MRITRIATSLLVLVVLGSAPAAAQRSFDLTASGGVAFPRNGARGGGPYLQLTAGRPIPGSVVFLRGEASLAGYPGGDSNVLALGASTLLTPRINRHPFLPYLIAGAAAYRVSQGSDDGVHFGVNGGAGVWLATIRGMDLVLELRYHVINDVAHTRYIPVALGVRF